MLRIPISGSNWPMTDIVIVSLRGPALNSKGDQLVLWYRLHALIDTSLRVHLILYESQQHSIPHSLLNKRNLSITYLSHGKIDYLWSILSTFFSFHPLEVRLFKNRKLERILEATAEHPPKAVIAITSRAWESIRTIKTDNLYIDLIDSYSLNYSRRPGNKIVKLYYSLQSRLHRHIERLVIEKSCKVFVVSPIDAKWIQGSKIRVLPNGVSSQSCKDWENVQGNTIGFLGNLNYGPNLRAVNWFALKVLPIVLESLPDAKFVIAGQISKPLSFSESKNIQILGRVDSQFDFFKGVAVAVAPMLDGSGMQNKVLEAMSVGTPVVATPIASRPIVGPKDSVLMEGTCPVSLAETIVELLQNKKLLQDIGLAGMNYVRQHYSWDSTNSLFLKEIQIVEQDNE
jgi:glycosyltransferase involved in cell wall biosynthesis